jgi:hypothetical protein
MTQAPPAIFKIPATGPRQGRPPRRAGEAQAPGPRGKRPLGVVLAVAAFLDWHPGQLAPLGSELVAAARQLRRALCIGGSQGRSSPVRISAPPAA